MVTHDNAQLFALSGPRNPYIEGKLEVVKEEELTQTCSWWMAINSKFRNRC